MNLQHRRTALLPQPATGTDALRRSWVLFALLGGVLTVLGALAIGPAFITTLTTVIVTAPLR
jgi:hypothetical protein